MLSGVTNDFAITLLNSHLLFMHLLFRLEREKSMTGVEFLLKILVVTLKILVVVAI